MTESVTRIRENDTRERVTVLETRLEAVSNNMEKLETKVEGQYQMLHERISDMRDDLRTEIDKNHEVMAKMLKEHMDAEMKHHQSIQEQVSAIDRWRWTIVGAATVVGYIIAHLKLEKLF